MLCSSWSVVSFVFRSGARRTEVAQRTQSIQGSSRKIKIPSNKVKGFSKMKSIYLSVTCFFSRIVCYNLTHDLNFFGLIDARQFYENIFREGSYGCGIVLYFHFAGSTWI